MELLKTVFQWLNLGALCLVATIFWSSIHRHKISAPAFDSAEDALSFIQTVYLIFWWAAGTATLWVFEVNPFWILAWMFIGFACGAYIEHLCKITGIMSFLVAGVQRYKEFVGEELARLGSQSE